MFFGLAAHNARLLSKSADEEEETNWLELLAQIRDLQRHDLTLRSRL